jgi:RHS repeat-associated protein
VLDDLGRVMTVTTDGVQPVETRFSTYGGSLVKHHTLQNGAPVKTEYMDLLGRVIAIGVESFDGNNGNEVIAKTRYNERGVKISEYAPWASSRTWGQGDGSSSSTFVTQYLYPDALGRIRTKTVLRSPALFESGRGEATLQTDYQYRPVQNGIMATITVHNGTRGDLLMSRTYDRGGKLVETIQKANHPLTEQIPAHYFYDPAGNLKLLVDKANDRLTATYDNLGRKTSVDDPDRGAWSYTWDGLSRLETQTDARSFKTRLTYDGIGRLRQRYVQVPGQTENPEAIWQYDSNGRLGVLDSMIGLDNFHRDYLYDPLLRPFKVTTSIPAGPAWDAHTFSIEYGYDRNYGRLKAMRYPSDELVALDYDSRGYALGETPLNASDLTRSSPAYRRVTAMSERGQVTSQTLGNGIVETTSYDSSTGMALSLNANGLNEPPPAGCSPAPLVRQANYTYDHFLNLAKQAKQFLLRDANRNIQFSGCTYDEVQRLLGSTRAWAGMLPDPTTPLADAYGYDDLGNITSKSDYGSLYTYGAQPKTPEGAGPHAVLAVSQGGHVASFNYDENGNMISGDGRTITFDKLDRPETIVVGGVTTQFRYAPDGTRYLQRTTGGAAPDKTVYYVDKDYERIDWPAPVKEERSYIGESTVVAHNPGPPDVRYVTYRHLDRLGSPDAMTNADKYEVLPEAHGFDAFGKPRGRDWQPNGDKLHPGGDFGMVTERGFTKHEHLDDTYLIHMNGRVYDYRLGRFLSVDPIISNPANPQSINPYSYIGNNPLSGVDPTGYEECTLLTGSHICNTAPAGSPLTINGIPVNGGSFGHIQPTGNAGSGANSGNNGAVNQGSTSKSSTPQNVQSPHETATPDANARGPVGTLIRAVDEAERFQSLMAEQDGRLLAASVWTLPDQQKLLSEERAACSSGSGWACASAAIRSFGIWTGLNSTQATADFMMAAAGGTPLVVAEEAGVAGTKAINLPAWRKVTVNLEHILERHTPEGALSEGKTVFPSTMNEKGILRAIRGAYESSTKIGVQGVDRVKLMGEGARIRIEMWFNKVTKTIETAYPSKQ